MTSSAWLEQWTLGKFYLFGFWTVQVDIVDQYTRFSETRLRTETFRKSLIMIYLLFCLGATQVRTVNFQSWIILHGIIIMAI